MSYEIYRQWKKIPNPNSRRPYLSVIIPVVNQADEILPTIGAVISQLCDVCSYWELIVVDGGSTDGTVERIAELALPNVSVIHAGRASSLANRLQRGILAARGNYILTTDSKNLAPIEEMARLLPHLERGKYDIAVGQRDNRAAKNAEANRFSLRHRLQMKQSDPTTALMIARQDAVKSLFRSLNHPTENPVKDICQLADKFQYKVSRVPVKFAGK